MLIDGGYLKRRLIIQIMNNEDKVILDLCGGTGAWSKPYRDNGYKVINVTLPEYDVRIYKSTSKIYGILAAPPCTEFAGSGARWWKDKGEERLLEGLSVVDACLRIIFIHNPVFWCLENPVGRLVWYLGKPKMYFNPCDYGDPYTKKTCLWGNFNIPTKNYVEPEFIEFISKKGQYKRMSKQHWNAFRLPKDKRAEARSITPSGFARAFYEANQ